MTKQQIKQIINEVNTNKEIKWGISKHTTHEITLTNSYDKSVSLSIKIKHDDLDEWIDVVDNHLGCRVVLLIWDEDGWGDYRETKQGIHMAIEAAVVYFNSKY